MDGDAGAVIPRHVRITNASRCVIFRYTRSPETESSTVSGWIPPASAIDFRIRRPPYDPHPHLRAPAAAAPGVFTAPPRPAAGGQQEFLRGVAVGAGLVALGVGYLLPLIYLIWSLRYGPKAEDNHWGAVGLEWNTTSPPPTENFTTSPVVTWDAYEYPTPVEGHVV